MREATAVGLEGHLESALAARVEACGEFFEAEAGRLARCCHAMAERFARGGDWSPSAARPPRSPTSATSRSSSSTP